MKTNILKMLWIAVAICLSGAPVTWAERPVKLGFVYILSGAFAAYGESARQGALLAVDAINRSGGINGRLVVTWFENSRSRATVAQQAIERLVNEKEVDCLIGIDSSTVAQHMAPVVAKLKTPLIITNAATPDVTGPLCNRYVFRISANLTQNIKGAVDLAARSGARKWTTVGKQHTFSYQSWEFFQKYLPAALTVAAEEAVFIPSRTKDFTPYLEKVLKSGADGILVTLWGGYLQRFVRQADALELLDGQRQVLMTMGASLDSLSGLGNDMPDGLWVGVPYWFLANESNLNKRFVANYRARFQAYPTHQAHGAYGAVYAFKAAAEKAGSTEPEAVVTALSGLTLELPGGMTTLRRWDHQGMADLWWGRTAADPAYPFKVLAPLKRFEGRDITRPPAETGCQLE